MKCNNQHKSTWEGRLLCHYPLWLWPHKLPSTLKNYSKVVPGALKCDAKGTKHQYMSWEWDQVCRRISESCQPTPAPFLWIKKMEKMLFCLVDFFYLFLKYFLVMFFPLGEASEASPPDLKHRKSQLFAFCAVSCSESFTGVHFVRSSSVWKDAESVCLCVCVDHRGEISHCLNLRQTYRAKCT